MKLRYVYDGGGVIHAFFATESSLLCWRSTYATQAPRPSTPGPWHATIYPSTCLWCVAIEGTLP